MKKLIILILAMVCLPVFGGTLETLTMDCELARSVDTNDVDLTEFDFWSKDPNRALTLDTQYVGSNYPERGKRSRLQTLELVADADGAENDVFTIDIGAYRKNGCYIPAATIVGTVGTRAVVTDPNGDTATGRTYIDNWSVSSESWLTGIEVVNNADGTSLIYITDTLGYYYWDIKMEDIGAVNSVNIWYSGF